MAVLVVACPSITAAAEGSLQEAEDQQRNTVGKLYAQHCAVCHGDDLSGGAQGPSLRAPILKRGESDGELASSIAEGYPESGMPSWSALLSPDQIRSLVIYLQEIRGGAGQDQSLGDREQVLPDGPVHSEAAIFHLMSVTEGLQAPYAIAVQPDGGVLVTEKTQGLKLLTANGRLSSPVAGTPRAYDDSTATSWNTTGASWNIIGNGWLLDVALHPQHEENGWIYLSHSDRCEDCNGLPDATEFPPIMTAIVRGRIREGRWVDQQRIWRAPPGLYRPNHDLSAGGRIAFDDEGYIFFTIGTLGVDAHAQNSGRPNGKVHRLHDDGRVPGDNPFRAQPGALGSVWSLGHRVPQGLAFDPREGRLWLTEHGPRGGDELNHIISGGNYGWPEVSAGMWYDGTAISDLPWREGFESPVVDWTPSIAVSNIVFYRGAAFPGWRDNLLVASLRGSKLLRLVVKDGRVVHSEVPLEGVGRLRDLDVAPDGSLYLLSEFVGGSRILRLFPVTATSDRPASESIPAAH
jgi:aldose sugar dehydrogenase